MMDGQAFTALAKQYMDMVLRLAFARLGNRSDAEDVTQNVFLALLQSDKAFESDAHLRHWLVRVTLNECRKHWRSPWSKREALKRMPACFPLRAGTARGCSTRSWRWKSRCARWSCSITATAIPSLSCRSSCTSHPALWEHG